MPELTLLLFNIPVAGNEIHFYICIYMIWASLIQGNLAQKHECNSKEVKQKRVTLSGHAGSF